MGFIIPTRTEILEAMRTNQYRPLLNKIFGDRWFEKLDPRMYLGITYEEFRQYVADHGIPQSLLVEDSNTGDDHFVIYKEDNKWIVGFAERGSIHTKSSHQSKELARLEVINRIWHCLDTDLNPAHFKGGVNEGTMVNN